MEIESLEEYLEICRIGKQGHDIYYRGQEDSTWGINSSISRLGKSYDKILQQKEILEKFKAELISEKLDSSIYTQQNGISKYSEWHYLAQMQHIGVPSPLIDLTIDETIALRFALVKQKKELEKDVAVFKYFLPINVQLISSENCQEINPYTTKEDWVVNLHFNWIAVKETAGENNRFNQKGRFLLHNFNRINIDVDKDPYQSERFEQIIIRKDKKEKIRIEFNKKFSKTNFENSEMYFYQPELYKIAENIKLL